MFLVSIIVCLSSLAEVKNSRAVLEMKHFIFSFKYKIYFVWKIILSGTYKRFLLWVDFFVVVVFFLRRV